MESPKNNQSEKKLNEDFNEAIVDVEALLEATANIGGERLAEVRSKAEKSIQIAKANIGGSKAAIFARAKAVTTETDVFVHDNPWKSIGFAVSVGAIIGMLIGRHR